MTGGSPDVGGGASPASPPPAGEPSTEGPQHRLVTYGTLVPGGVNHDVVAAIPGSWEQGTVTGTIEWLTPDIPRLRWAPDGAVVAAWLLRSSALPAHWPDLDDFEGPAYVRRVVPVATVGGVLHASCYVHPRFPLPGSEPSPDRG